jgi:hypothetical protein
LGIQTRWVALALSPILIGGEILSPQPRHFSRGYGPSTADDYGRQTGSSKRN